MLERGRQKEIAEALGVSNQYINMVIKGKRSVSSEMAERIVAVAPELEGKFIVINWKKIRYVCGEDNREF